MLKTHIKHLVCPLCKSNLEAEITQTDEDRIKEGILKCSKCNQSFPICNYIPRFILETNNYSAGFGFQWNKHSNTQYDSYTGLKISEERFFNETKWSRDLTGEIILEAGCGSGRFTEHAISTGAMVVSFDYSNAVDANYKNNGKSNNVLIVQASIYDMPFRNDYFSKVFCIGVIQHTPDPYKSFSCLTQVLSTDGSFVVDAYKILPWYKMIFLTKYWVRPLTRRLPNDLLYTFCVKWVSFWWNITGIFVHVTGRRFLSWFLLIADYRGVYPLSDKNHLEWAILDTFDMLSPAYDFPQTLESVKGWFEAQRMKNIEVHYGYNGIEGRGQKS